jgi:hypothetical protein
MHCAAAACACDDAARTVCAGGCVDTTTSHDACGSCTKRCSAAATCTSSKCVARYGHPEITTGTVATNTGYFLIQAITVSNALTVSKLGFNEVSGTPNAVLGLYTDSAGTPQKLLAQTAIFAVTVGVNEIPLTTPVTLPPGTYWMMLTFSGTAYIGLASTGNYFSSTFTFSGTLPDPCPAGTADSRFTFGIWLSGTE